MPAPMAPAIGSSIGSIITLRARRLKAGSADARSLQDCTNHPAPPAVIAAMPSTKKLRLVTKPRGTGGAPMGDNSGQRLGRAALRAAADASNASGSIADTF